MLAGDVLSFFMMFVSEQTKFIVLMAACVIFFFLCDPYEIRKKKRDRSEKRKDRERPEDEEE